MVQLDSGTWPAGPDQVVVDAHTASKLHLKPGSTLRVALATGARGFVVTGTIGFGGAGDIAGLSVVGFPSGTAGRLLGTAGAYAAVEAAPAAGLDSAVLQQHQMLRSPRRVAGTTGTLAVSVATVSVATVSVATVSIVAALAAAVSASDAAEVQRSLHADFVVSTSPQATLDTALARRIAAIPGVTGTAAIPCGIVKFPGDSERACGIDPATFERYADLHVTRGSRADLTAGTIAVSALSAARNGWHLGQTVAATFPAGGTENLRVVALFDDEQVASAYLIPAADYAQWFPASLQGDYLILITAAAGKSSPVHAALAVLLSDYPQAFLDDKAGFIHRTVAGIDLLMTMMTGLLALSLLIGLLSLTTSLALSVLERTRETGLLRAIGAEARQIKALIRADAIVAGLLAAAVPARRAARMNVLESLAAQ
ncbi:MAG: hypothetical protein HOV87_33915 [Catenulispora sp.]|nr:hypothetical protein [Catenulispora sp.]